MHKRLVVWFGLIAASMVIAAGQAGAAEPARPEVLILGMYHMNNPGQDIFNSHADDVLAPKRQQEIAQLMEVLKKFHPTKVAVEATLGSRRVARNYADYLEGKYTLSRDETDQIGYRLAKELGHKQIYPVDVEGDFPFPRVVNYAKANNRSKELDAMMSETGSIMKAKDDYLASHSILDTLVYMNADDYVAKDMSFYYRLARFGEPDDWAGADVVAAWFQRNMRIYHNLLQLVDSPNERILVIYGAGHLGWLRQNVTGSPDLRLRKLAEFAR